MVRTSHFACFHAGPKEGWAQFRLEPPEVPVPARGKLFLRKLLGSLGLEMSLNVVPPGQGMPFLHRHQHNDEVYVVVGGRGQFLVDGECIDVAEGTVLRLRPAAARALAEQLRCAPVLPLPPVPGRHRDRGRHRRRPEGRGQARLADLTVTSS